MTVGVGGGRSTSRKLVDEYYIDALVKVRAVESGTVSFGAVQAGYACTGMHSGCHTLLPPNALE